MTGGAVNPKDNAIACRMNSTPTIPPMIQANKERVRASSINRLPTTNDLQEKSRAPFRGCYAC